MEEIINKIIDIDSTAKLKINMVKEKEENIETYINEQLEKEKNIIESKYQYKKKNIQEKYNTMIKEKKQELDEEKERQIENIKNIYQKTHTQILEQILEDIIVQK